MAKTPCMGVLFKAVLLASIATSNISPALSAETDNTDDSIITPDALDLFESPPASDKTTHKAHKAKKAKKAKKKKKAETSDLDQPTSSTPEPTHTPDLIKTPAPVETPAPVHTPEPVKTTSPVKIHHSASPTKIKYEYEGTFGATFAGHFHDPQDLASQKLDFGFQQDVTFDSHWKGALGISAWNEASFATVPARYTGSVIRDDSRDLRFRNVYLQYRGDNFFLRVGNQQVVWGEAFGFFYSDIINPKDLRYGLFGDFSDIRLQVPMVNAKATFSDFSIQGIFIPKPYFDILPSPGNDFAYPYQNVIPIPNIQINRESSLPISAHSMEAGARVSYLLGRLDLSAFFFNYIDHDPWYGVSPQSDFVNTLILEEHHSRVQSYGLTATDDFGGFIFRVEALTTRNRTLPLAVSTPFGTVLGTTQLDDYIYVIGVDVPTWEKWNLGFQWSQDILSQDQVGLFRERTISLASVRLQHPLFTNQSAELLYTYSVGDAGQRVELNYLIPLSGKIETTFGIDVLGGPPTSTFGQIYQATRGFVLFKYFLKSQG